MEYVLSFRSSTLFLRVLFFEGRAFVWAHTDTPDEWARMEMGDDLMVFPLYNTSGPGVAHWAEQSAFATSRRFILHTYR